MDLFLSLLFSFFLLILFGVIFIGINKYLKINKIRLTLIFVLFITGFILYFLGYYEEGKEIVSSSKAFFSAVQMIVLNNNFDNLTNPIISESNWGIPVMTLISVLMFAIVAQTIVITVFKDFFSYVNLKYSRDKFLYLFYGFDESFTKLYNNMSSNNLRFFFIVNNEEKPKVIEKGFNCLSINKKLPKILIPNKNIYVFFLSFDENLNIKIASLFLSNPWKQQNIHLYIRCHDFETLNTLERNYPNKQSNSLTINIVNDDEILVREALKYKPIYSSMEIDYRMLTPIKPFKFFIGGMNSLGLAFFRHLTIQGQFVNNLPEVVFHDDNSQRHLGVLYIQNPEVTSCIKISSLDIPIETTKYYENLINLSKDLNYIILTYQDQNSNISITKNLISTANQQSFKLPIILCYVPDNETRRNLVNNDIYQDVCFFGSLDEIMNIDDLIKSKIDQEASNYHDAYEKIYAKEMQAQDLNYVKTDYFSLNYFLKESNRSLIDNIPIKLALLKLSKNEVISQFNDKDGFLDYIKDINNDGLKTLSEMEHLRWNAFHYVRGWIKLPIEEVKQRKSKGIKPYQKDIFAKKHGCLVSFEELNALDEILDTKYQTYDENNVLNIPEILRLIKTE